MNQELTDVQAGFRKGGGSRDQIANIPWITEKTKEFQKNISFIGYAKASDCVDHNKLWEILKEMGIPDHITCLLRNLYAGQAAVRTGHVPGGPVLRIWHSHCPGLGSIPSQGSLSPSSQPATYQSPQSDHRTRHGTTDWLKTGKGVHQDCVLSLCSLTYMQSTS